MVASNFTASTSLEGAVNDALGLPAPAVAADEAMIRFDPSQRRLFDDPSRIIAVNWHRQKGKDFVTAAISRHFKWTMTDGSQIHALNQSGQ